MSHKVLHLCSDLANGKLLHNKLYQSSAMYFVMKAYAQMNLITCWPTDEEPSTKSRKNKVLGYEATFDTKVMAECFLCMLSSLDAVVSLRFTACSTGLKAR